MDINSKTSHDPVGLNSQATVFWAERCPLTPTQIFALTVGSI